MPYRTRLEDLQWLRRRVDEEIAIEVARQRRRQQQRAHAERPPVHVVRTWARAVGHDVGVRGAISQDLVDAYLQAQGVES